jgi:hypothetical protein
MDHVRVALRCGQFEEHHAWPLTAAGAVASPGSWAPARLPGRPHLTLTNAPTGLGAWEFGLSAEARRPADVTAEVRVRLRCARDPVAGLGDGPP